ncbi:LPD38 domain-containing protein [uncultured Bacteroides sp.]|jgi:hypothetical protein|uniref:LPD38 domain-containing protein n=1 Tax=uncultured Bacteroides sp. TaxID=162156 RepID=UPI002048A4FB|nr:LPD38 domain-containing protein [uncultured Bacteroides sp.]DAR49996.1 MAG TPA: Type I restriction enzyme [Caudoviricetes sp.]
MTNTIDNVGALYKALRQKGFSDIGTEDIFRNKLQDENNRKQLYDALRKNGYDDIGDYDTFNIRVGSSYQSASPVQEVDSNYTAGQVDVGDINGDVPEYLQRPEEQETIKGFVPAFKQGSDALYQGMKSSVGETANLLAGSSRDYTKAQRQLQELVDSGYDLTGFDKEKALKDYKDRQFQRDMDSWEEMMQQRRKEREGMGFLDALVHKFKDPDRPRDQYDSSAVAFNKMKVGDEVQLGRAFDAIQEALTQANGDVEKAYTLLGEQSAKETWGDKTSREAREAMREFKPTEGTAAWVGNIVPQMIGNVAGIAASVSPWTRWLARPLGVANLGMLTASSSGSAMADAREYAEQTGKQVSEGDVLRVGAISGTIEAGTEMLPYGRFFGGIHNSVAKKLGKEVTNAIAGNPAARRELSSLLRDAGSELSTKLFTKEAGKRFIGDVSIEGFSEFLAEGGGTLVPMIYQNPEDYPTLYEVLQNGWEGAKAGIFMGSILGGASSTIGHYQNRARRKQQGKMMLADTKDGVLEVVGQTGEDKYMAVDGKGMPHEITRDMVNDFEVVDFQEFDTYCKAQTEENLQKAVENGRSLAEDMDRTKKHAAKLELDKASRGLTPEMIEEMDGVSPTDYLASHEDVAEQVLPYLNAKAKYEGLIQGVREGIDGKIEQSNTYIDKNTHTDGRIYSARLKVDDEPVSIVSGDVALDENGLIDKERSAGRFIVMNSKGELQMRDRDDILSVDGISDAHEMKLTTAETIRQQEAQRAADEIEGKREFVQGEEVETYLNGMRVLVGVQAQNEDGTITVTDGKNEILTTREELQRGVDIVEQMRIDEELAAEQQGNDLASSDGMEDTYALNTELSFQTENGVVRGSVTNERNADGLIEVWTEEPLNGKKVNLFTEEELNALLDGNNTDKLNKESGVDLQNLSSEILQRANVTTDNGARNTINSNDSKIEGGLILNNLPQVASTIDSHGIAKGNELEHLLNFLINGVDTSRRFDTAPLGKASHASGSGLGTASGTSYRDGLFIIASKPNSMILDADGKTNISTVLINDMSYQGGNPLGESHAKAIQKELSNMFPKVDFVLYSEANDYYSKTAVEPAQNETPEQKLQKLQKLIETLPKKKDGKVDYKALTPQQQFEYTSAVESPEMAIEDLKIYMSAKSEELEKLNARLTKAIGGERAEIRDLIRDKKHELDELSTFYQSVVSEQTEEIGAKEEDETPRSIMDVDMLEWTAENSTDLNEVITAYNEAKQLASHDIKLQPWEQALLGRKVSTDSFVRFSDKNHITGQLAKAWLRKDGVGIDQIQKEFEMEGLNVSEQDIVDFMLRHPSNHVRTTSDTQNSLGRRFSEIATKQAGMPIGGPESVTGKLFLQTLVQGKKLEGIQQAIEKQATQEDEVMEETFYQSIPNDALGTDEEIMHGVLDGVEYIDGEYVFNDAEITAEEIDNIYSELELSNYGRETETENSQEDGITNPFDEAREIEEPRTQGVAAEEDRETKTGNSGTGIKNAFSYDKIVEIQEGNQVDEYDRLHGTQIGEMLNAIDAIQSNDTERKQKYNQRHFRINKTSDFLKSIGVKGDYFTVRTGVISRHINKDGSHGLGLEEWKDVAMSLSSPFAVTKYDKKDNAFRIWTNAKINNSYIVVGVDVKVSGKDMFVNSISTAFGLDNTGVSKDKIVWYDEKNINPAQRSVLNGLNSQIYPEAQGLFYGNKDNEFQEEKQISSQETIAKAENQKVLPDLLPAQEDRETETGNSGTGIDYTGSYTLSGVLSDNGERFYQDINGNINLVQIPLNVFEAIHKEPAPFRLIPSMLSHVFDRHGKEMKLQNAADAIKFVLDVMNNFDHVRQGESKALIFSVENGRNRIGQRAITVLLDSKNGEYYGIKTSGYERLDGLRKRALLWEKGANETSTTDVASVNVTTAKAQQGNELSGSASNQSNALSDNKNSEFQEEKQISSQETIAKAEQEVDSSPSEAQKEAGNYRKGHVKIDGFDITIENPKGSVRSGVDGDGKPWSVTMNNTYGYIRGTEGVDGDHIDIFLGEHMEAPNVYVVDQVKQDGSFDEHKVMYGFNSALAAKRAYLKNYSAGWKGLGNITGVSKEVFREWIDSSHRKTKPFNEYKSVRDAVQSEMRQRAEQTEAVVTSNESETKDAGIFTVEDVNAIKNNPLTVEEIESAAVEPELKTLAKDYLAGNESFINLVAYQNIYNDVRNRTRGIEPNSTGASETQLDEVINGNQGGLESGFGRGEVDNVGAEGSETPVSRRGRSGKTGTEQPTLFDGERSDHEVRGEEPAVDGVSPGRGYSDGSGSAGGNGRDVSRPARGKTGSRGTKNDTGGRTNAEHERVDAVDKSSVSVDADLQSALDDFKDILHQFGKAGKNDMSLSLVGLNKEQIQLLPRLVSSGVKLGYQLIRKEVYDFKKWAEQMRSFIGDPLKQAIGYSDTDVNAFIREMWNSKFEIDGEVHTLAEWSAKLGTKELKRQVSATLEEKRAQQMAAESIPVKIADAQNIDETLPYLLPQQREDVRLAEVQFFDDSHQDREHGHGKGYLFTNGTGTGKTYTGLGIVKRFIKQGKNRILVVTPSQPKVTDWMKDATNLGIELRDLDTLSKEKGTTATTEKGEGAVITTFANLRQNKALLEDTFDLIVYDESHRIMENKQGEATIGADVHFMITNRNTNDALRRYSVINPKYQAWQKAQELYKKEMESSRLLMQHAGDNEIGAKGDEYAKRLEDAKAAMQSAEKEWEEEEKRLKPLVDNAVKTTKTVFLSATPFNTRESLSYAEGYIFSYPKENTNTVGSYHHHSPQTEFYLTHFGAGYKFRYGRLERGLTNADALVKQEIAFSDYLENELGTKSGRIIDSEYDYSRDFPMVTLKRAQDINDAIECVWREDALSPLSDALRQVWFNYNYTSALLETMKISATIPRIREHLKMGRKVVVFHRRVQSKAALNPPFKTMLSIAREQMRSESNAEAKKKLQDAITLFEKRHEGLLQYEQTLDYSMPREQIAEAFGAENVLFFSGKESGKTKNKAVETFNDDDSGKNIIVIQEASGKEGISLHDTSGKHQRVLITLALPQSPITALQIEGRIYRIGNKSNAIFEYPLLGLDSEMILFGQQFNQQVSTTENLALGSKARDLRSSFTRGVEEHTNVPLEQQGFGGKEFDKGKMEMADPFEDAVLDYYGNQKVKGRRDNREGMDYFATPEPVGFKMVEWAMPQEGETALEPSAGHGAIARYVSRDVSLTAIEPSSSLFGKLQLKAGGMGRKFVNDLFENYAVQNKHDVIVMNPPFGAAGKKAMDHLEKAFDHLTEGGRVVALIPHGQMDKRFEKWYGEKKEAVVTAEINLPPCTFEQAGTSVYAHIVVIDRIGREETRRKAPYRRNIDLSGIKTVKELFERLKDVEVPGRTIDKVARNMKNAKKTVKEFKEIKGVDVVVDTDGVYAYNRSGMTLFSQRFDSESMANIPNEYARMHYWIEANGTVDMGNRTKERIEVYVTGMKTLRNLTGKTHEQLMEESKDGKSVLPAENTVRTDATSEQQRSGDKYSYKEDRNTKTGEVMHLAIPLSKDLDRELYLQMVACAKRNDGYWNRFKKAFHFQTKEGADRFIKESATIGEDGNIRFRIHDDDVNERFNEELSRYKDGRMKSNEMFHLGTPQGAMLAFLPDLPIVMHQRTVRKGIEKKHNVDVNMLKDMPSMIASPIFVFQRDVKNIGILTEMVDRDGKNVCVAIEMNKTIQDGTNILEVNDIRSFHGREVENIIKPIRDNGTLRWVDKEKGFDWITSALHNFKQAQSSQNLSEEDFSSVTKIVESFENPTIEQGKIVSEVENLADELQTTVRVVKSIEELPEGNLARKRIENGDGIKGWFDTKSEEMAIFLPNAKSVEDARATVFHEVVAHKGLRGLLGKEFAPFLDRVYKDLSESVRREVVELSKKHGWDLRVGMEEYMARLAEHGFADRESSSVWNKIKNAFMDAVHRLKIELGFRLRDNDLRYILWKSYQNLKGGNGILEQAQDIAFQMELGVGRFRKEDDADVHYGKLSKEAARLEELTGRGVHIGRNEDEVAFMMSIEGVDAKTIDEVRDTFARAREEGKKFFGFFDSETGKVYLCADQIQDIRELRGIWAHENAHLATLKTISDNELENLYKAIGEEEFANVLDESYLIDGLSKARVVDEYFSFVIQTIASDKESMVYIVSGKIEEVLDVWDIPKSIIPYIESNLKYIFYGEKEIEKNEQGRGRDLDAGSKFRRENLSGKENYNRKDESGNGVVVAGRSKNPAESKRETERREERQSPTDERGRNSEKIEKGKLPDSLIGITTPGFNQTNSLDSEKLLPEEHGITNPSPANNSPVSDFKDKRSISILQNKENNLLWNESEPRNVATEPTDTLTGLSHKSAGNAIDTVSQNNSSSANVENKTDNTKSNEENIKSRSASLNSGSESVYLQQTNNNDNVSESISQRINGKMSKEDSRIEEALSKCKRGGEQDAKNAREAGRTLSERQQKEVEARVMEKYAKDNGMWIPMQDVFSLGIPAPSGNENDVYLDSKDNSVYKVNNLMNSKKISSLLERIKLHNLFFPQTKYELAGFSGFGSSDVYPVLKQDYIVNSTFATPEDIDAYMNKLGFKQIGEAAYSNGEYVISDLRPRNVLKDADGDIYVVDADFKSEGSDKGGGIRFRDSDSSSGEAMREYEGAVKTNLYKFQEAYQDSMLGLLKLQESVVNETKTDLADNENAYMAENQLSSKNAYEMEFYKDRFFKPMMDAVKGFIKHGHSYEDVKEYMMAKSGLERNEVFAMRDAQRKMDERMKELETLLDINAISEEEYEEMRAMAEEQRDLDYAENRERDYSGLSSLMADTEQYEEMAQELVDNFEEGNEKAVAELWKRVNDATKSTLLKTYKSGMMTKGVYDHVKGMFEYYIPMRGWTEDVAADVYDYILSERSPFNAPVRAAQGRTSLADDPLATIGNMAESAIMQGNRNMMKQKFLNLVENHPTSLATVQKVWYENMGTKEEPVWEQSFPDIPENANADEVAVAIEEHEARMKELKKNGMAKDERSGVNLKYRASKREMNEHIVVVKRGGREYAVYVNGNPRAAQAINGLTNPDTIEHKGVKLVQRLNRQLAANFTTRNPAFVLSNLSRDLIFSTTAIAVKEKGKYARRFNANIAKNTLGMVKLMKRYQDGKLDMGKERDRLFKEFLENGGETGYTALHSVDEYKKLIDREVMDAKGKVDLGRVFGLKPGKVTTSTTLGIVPAFQFISKWTEFGNRCAEDVSRFTAYMTSRQEGRSVQRSIADAKEITVNFNKKGAGGYGATTFKSLYLFFNAGVQSLNNFYRLAKGNPKKFNSALLGFTAAGVLLPMLNEFLIDMWGDDDDKDKYDNLPEWVRRNNFCFWLGDDRFVTIPLPIELRAFYGMGEIFNQWTKGNMKHKNVGYELVNQITELIPLNPLGGNGDVVSSFVPDAGKPFYQVMTNKDYFGKPIYKETDFNVLMPEFTKAYKGTSSALVASSDLLNEVTGGDKYTRGWANVNPAKVEHIFEGYFGGMGKTINQLGKTIGMIWDEDQRVMRNVPVVNRFLNGTDDRNAFSRVNEEYYHYLEEFRETEQRLKGYEKEADLGIMEYAEKVNFLEYSKEYQRYEIFKDYQKELKELQTEIKEAVGKDEKRFLENQLNFVKMELVERLNEMED